MHARLAVLIGKRGSEVEAPRGVTGGLEQKGSVSRIEA